MDIAEVLPQLAGQVQAKGVAPILCIDTASGDVYEVMDISWDDETESHVIEIQPAE